MVDKAFHWHAAGYSHYELSKHDSFRQPTKDCPICDFEFFSFITGPQFREVANFTGVPVYNAPAPGPGYSRLINYFSLRAPPGV